MLNRKLSEIAVDPTLQHQVDAYNVAGGWDSKADAVIKFKYFIQQRLYRNQDGKCAYCGLPLDTRGPEIDHIAPKGGRKRPKYPQVTFLPINLVYACHCCNSSSHKGQTDVVEKAGTAGDYRNWSFKLVHPYLDDPKEYFRCTGGQPILFLPADGIDDAHRKKVKYTIELFGLDNEATIMEIAKQISFEQNPEPVKARIREISTYMGT